MRARVLQAFPSFSAKFESDLAFMYTDVKGLVTTGIGNLIDPIAFADVLPWKRGDGSRATRAEIESEWHTVKNAWPEVQSVACRAITTLRLDPPDVDQLVSEKAHANDAEIRGQFPDFDTWPCDGQLAIHSMAWAQGASFAKWPHLLSALRAGDFMTAAGPPGNPDVDTAARGEAWMNDAGNSGLRPRNRANKVLWQNAARVVSGGLDLETLYWPTELPEGASGGSRGSWGPMGQLALVVLALGGAAAAAVHFTPWGQKWLAAQKWVPKEVRAL